MDCRNHSQEGKFGFLHSVLLSSSMLLSCYSLKGRVTRTQLRSLSFYNTLDLKAMVLHHASVVLRKDQFRCSLALLKKLRSNFFDPTCHARNKLRNQENFFFVTSLKWGFAKPASICDQHIGY
jgi:hypothetical protein